MSQSTTSQTPNMARLGEVIADIAFMAGNMFAAGKLPEVENSRELMSDIMVWANQFEEAFDQAVHGDDYIELIDAFAEYRLRGKDADAERILSMMKRLKAIRYGTIDIKAKAQPAEKQTTVEELPGYLFTNRGVEGCTGAYVLPPGGRANVDSDWLGYFPTIDAAVAAATSHHDRLQKKAA